MHVAIFSDNANTVGMFNSLRVQPDYNGLLTTAVDLLLLRALHIPGDDNTVANALSHCHFDITYSVVPSLCVTTFQPPQLTLGVVQL